MNDLKPELAVSKQAAEDICARLDPSRRVSNVRKIYGGEIAAIHEIAFADGGPALILKLYPDSLNWKMRKEAAIMTLVSGRLRTAVPRVLLTDAGKHVLPLSYLVMSKLEGSMLGALESGLSPDAMHDAYSQIGALLRDFHRIEMDAFGYIGEAGIVTPHADNHAYLAHQFDRKCAEFARRGGPPALAQRIAEHVAARADLFRGCDGARLCHNDLHAGNLIAHVDDGRVRLVGVLDFEGALAGDPLFDVAKAMFYLRPSQRSAMLAGYGAIARPDWRATLDLYHLYFTLELWCWFAQIDVPDRLPALAADLDRHLTPS